MPFSTTVADKVIDTALRELGAKLGADAVVVIGNRVQGNGPPFVGGWRTRTPEAVPQREIVAVAIKYQ